MIKDVLINGNKQPEIPPTVLKIHPQYSAKWWLNLHLEGWERAHDAIIRPRNSYGFWVSSIFNPIESITVKYRYLGIRYSYTVEVPEE